MEEEFYIPESDVTFSMKMIRFYFHRLGWLAPNYTAKLFWKLFTTPRLRKTNPRHQSFLNQAVSASYKSEKNKTEFTIHKFGHGDKVVLICHGWEGRTTDFKGLIEELLQQGNVQIWSIDFPGHGVSPQSEAHLPMFIDVINTTIQLNQNIEIFIGHSLGAASIAMSVPENPSFFIGKKLVLLGLHPIPSQFFDQYRKVTRISDKLYKKCVSYAESKVGNSLREYDCHNHINLFDKNYIHFVHDKNDKIIKVERIKKMMEQIPNASCYFGENGGHFKHFKHEDVVTDISTFIKNK